MSNPTTMQVKDATGAIVTISTPDALLALLAAGIGGNVTANVGCTSIASDNPALSVKGDSLSGATDSATGPIKIGGPYNLTLPTAADGYRVNAQFGTRGSQNVTLMASDSASAIAQLGTNLDGVTANSATTRLGVCSMTYKFNGTTLDRWTKPISVSRIVSAAASTNATSAKGSAGNVQKAIGYNAAASLRYLKFYNKASAPTVGTDTPVLTIPLAPTSVFNIALDEHYFSTGIAYALTTGSADNDTGALTAADIVSLNISYS